MYNLSTASHYMMNYNAKILNLQIHFQTKVLMNNLMLMWKLCTIISESVQCNIYTKGIRLSNEIQILQLLQVLTWTHYLICSTSIIFFNLWPVSL